MSETERAREALVDIRPDKHSVDGVRVWLEFPDLHPDLAMCSFILKPTSAPKLAERLRAALGATAPKIERAEKQLAAILIEALQGGPKYRNEDGYVREENEK